MVTVGYKSGKAQYNASTGKQCEGCCEEFGINCSNCATPSETPASINVTITDIALCGCTQFTLGSPSGCSESGVNWTTWYKLVMDTSVLNTSHTLEQISACTWRKRITVDTSVDFQQHEGTPPADPCGGTFFCSQLQDTSIDLLYFKTSLTTANFVIQTTGAGNLLARIDGFTAGDPSCVTANANFPACGSVNILLGDGSISVSV